MICGLQVGALDGLAALDRDHAVGPRDVLPALRNEVATRRRLEGGDQFLVDDPLAAQPEQESGKAFAVVECHASAFVSWSRNSCAVRSSFIGVTETKPDFTACRSVPSRSSVSSRPKRSQ